MIDGVYLEMGNTQTLEFGRNRLSVKFCVGYMPKFVHLATTGILQIIH
jgi:hypothetical protein